MEVLLTTTTTTTAKRSWWTTIGSSCWHYVAVYAVGLLILLGANQETLQNIPQLREYVGDIDGLRFVAAFVFWIFAAIAALPIAHSSLDPSPWSNESTVVAIFGAGGVLALIPTMLVAIFDPSKVLVLPLLLEFLFLITWHEETSDDD